MHAPLRIQTKVLPGHRIEVTAPELVEGASVEVLVVPSDPTPPLTPLEVFRMPLDERRKLLAREADRLVDYYESTAEDRVEWQGGDIVE